MWFGDLLCLLHCQSPFYLIVCVWGLLRAGGCFFHRRGRPWIDGSSHGNELRGKWLWFAKFVYAVCIQAFTYRPVYIHRVLRSQFAGLFFTSSASPLRSCVTWRKNLTSLNFTFLNCKMGLVIIGSAYLTGLLDSFSIILKDEIFWNTHGSSNYEPLWDFGRGMAFSFTIYRWENWG